MKCITNVEPLKQWKNASGEDDVRIYETGEWPNDFLNVIIIHS